MEARVPDYRDHHKFPDARALFPCPPVVKCRVKVVWRTAVTYDCASSVIVASQKVGLPSRGFFRASWRKDRGIEGRGGGLPRFFRLTYRVISAVQVSAASDVERLSFSLPFLPVPHLIRLSLSRRISSVCTLNAHRSYGRSIRAATTTYPPSFDKTRLIHSRKFACRKQRHTAFPRHVALFPLNESSIR